MGGGRPRLSSVAPRWATASKLVCLKPALYRSDGLSSQRLFQGERHGSLTTVATKTTQPGHPSVDIRHGVYWWWWLLKALGKKRRVLSNYN